MAGWANEFQLNSKLAAPSSYKLTEPTLGASLAQPVNLGNYQLAAPDVGGMPSASTGSIAGAGIGAAGQTVSILAQLMGAQAARGQAAEQSQLGRASSEAIARMQIKAAAEMAAKQRQDDATRYLLGAMQNSTNAGFTARDTNRMANQGAGNLIAQAFMRR